MEEELRYPTVATRHLVAGFLLVLRALASSTAVAAVAPPLWVVGSPEACPSPELLIASLRPLFPEVQSRAGEPRTETIEIQDFGSTYRIRVGARERVFADDARQCEERARDAAIFVALVLEPPSIDLPTEPTSPPPPAPPPLHRSLAIQIDVGATLVAAPRSAPENSPVTAGGSLRLSIGGHRWRGVLGVSGLAPTLLGFATAKARLSRIPLDLSLRGLLEKGRFRFGVDLGAIASIVVVEGVDVGLGATDVRPEFGVRLATRAELWLHYRLALYLSISGTLVPLPYELILNGTPVGTLPIGWIDGELGLSFRIR